MPVGENPACARNLGVIGFDCNVEAERSVPSGDAITKIRLNGENNNSKVYNLAAYRTPALALAA